MEILQRGIGEGVMHAAASAAKMCLSECEDQFRSAASHGPDDDGWDRLLTWLWATGQLLTPLPAADEPLPCASPIRSYCGSRAGADSPPERAVCRCRDSPVCDTLSIGRRVSGPSSPVGQLGFTRALAGGSVAEFAPNPVGREPRNPGEECARIEPRVTPSSEIFGL